MMAPLAGSAAGRGEDANRTGQAKTGYSLFQRNERGIYDGAGIW